MTDEKLVRLLKKSAKAGGLPCLDAGGRFGEDDCRKCENCRIHRELERREREKKHGKKE